MALRLITGPANCGKTGRVLDAFVASLDAGADPWLVAPTRPDALRLERELAERLGALVGGRVGTLDAAVREVLDAAGLTPSRWLGAIEKRLVLESLAHSADLSALAASRGTAGFADALGGFVDELGQAMVEPRALVEALKGRRGVDPVATEAAGLYGKWREYLKESRALDAVTAVGLAAGALGTDAGAWPENAPLFLLGFDDLSPAEIAVIEGLSHATGVTVALAWMPDRPAFTAVDDVAFELMRIADEHEAVEAEPGRYRSDVLFETERRLFELEAEEALPMDRESFGALAAAGPRAEVELVASEVVVRLAAGTPPERIAVVARSVIGYRALVRQVFGQARIPYDMEATVPLGQVPLGRAVLALARFSVSGERDELFRLALSSYGGLAPDAAARFEATVRRLGIGDGRRAASLLTRLVASGEAGDGPGTALLGSWLAPRRAADAFDLLRLAEEAAPAMLVNAYGRTDACLGDEGAADAAAAEALREAIAELRRLANRGQPLATPDVLAALERVDVRTGVEGRRGRVQVLPVIRARGRRFDTVILVGMNERSFPRTPPEDPFFGPDVRALLATAGIGLKAPPGMDWERYLFYTAATRARSRLVAAYQAASADGRPLTRSFFIDDLEDLFRDPDDPPDQRPLKDVTRTKGLAHPAFAEPGEAPGEVEHRRALAARFSAAVRRIGRGDLERIAKEAPAWLARAAPPAVGHEPALTGDAARALAERRVFSATQLEAFARCPVKWFVEHELAPERLDRELGPLERGTVIHEVLAALGPDIADPRFGEDEAFTAEVEAGAREALEKAIARIAGGLDGVAVDLAHRLADRQLDAFLAMQADRDRTFVPLHFELAFGRSEESEPWRLTEDIGLRGSIDRVDVAGDGRAFVLDYKSGKSQPTVKELLDDEHLQVRLYCLAWEELRESRAVGGGYWALGAAAIQGLFDAEDPDACGLGLPDLGGLSEEKWRAALARAREVAADLAERIRRAEIAPKKAGSACWYCEHQAWCGLWQ